MGSELLVARRDLLRSVVGRFCPGRELPRAVGQLAQTGLQLRQLRGELLVASSDLLCAAVGGFRARRQFSRAVRELAQAAFELRELRGQLLVARRDLLSAPVGGFRSGGKLPRAVCKLVQPARQGLRAVREFRCACLQGGQLGLTGRGGFELPQAVAELPAAVGEAIHTVGQGARALGQLFRAVGSLGRAACQGVGAVMQFHAAVAQLLGPVAQLPGGRADVLEALLHVGQRFLHHVPAVLAQGLVEVLGQGIGKSAGDPAGEVIGTLGDVEVQQAVFAAAARQRFAAEVGGQGQREVDVAAPHGGLRFTFAVVPHEIELGVFPEFLVDFLAQVVVFAAEVGALVEVHEAHRDFLQVAVGVVAAGEVDGGVQQRRHGDGGGGEPHHGVMPQAAFGGGQDFVITRERHGRLLAGGQRGRGPAWPAYPEYRSNMTFCQVKIC